MSYVLDEDLCRACGRGVYCEDLSAGARVPGSWCSSCNSPRPGNGMWHSLCGKAFPDLAAFRAHVYDLAGCSVYAERPDLFVDGSDIPALQIEAAKPLVNTGPRSNKTGRRGRPRKSMRELRAADARRHREARKARLPRG